jgi:hypothetical protein
MKQFFKTLIEVIKEVQQARAAAVVKGQHWV